MLVRTKVDLRWFIVQTSGVMIPLFPELELELYLL